MEVYEKAVLRESDQSVSGIKIRARIVKIAKVEYVLPYRE